jgi:hypothetical protein
VTAALLLALTALSARAAEPAAPPAVAASTAAAAAAPAPQKPARRLFAKISADAKGWKPLSLRAAGGAGPARTQATLRVSKVKGRDRGTPSAAKACARLHKAGDDRALVISVFPAALARRRAHVEVRFKLVEGFVEKADAALVSVTDRRRGAGAGLDSYELRARGVEFEEDSPGSGAILVSALDPRPRGGAVNAGTLKRAAFDDRDVGTADVSWSVTGFGAPR